MGIHRLSHGKQKDLARQVRKIKLRIPGSGNEIILVMKFVVDQLVKKTFAGKFQNRFGEIAVGYVLALMVFLYFRN